MSVTRFEHLHVKDSDSDTMNSSRDAVSDSKQEEAATGAFPHSCSQSSTAFKMSLSATSKENAAENLGTSLHFSVENTAQDCTPFHSTCGRSGAAHSRRPSEPESICFRGTSMTKTLSERSGSPGMRGTSTSDAMPTVPSPRQAATPHERALSASATSLPSKRDRVHVPQTVDTSGPDETTQLRRKKRESRTAGPHHGASENRTPRRGRSTTEPLIPPRRRCSSQHAPSPTSKQTDDPTMPPPLSPPGRLSRRASRAASSRAVTPRAQCSGREEHCPIVPDRQASSLSMQFTESISFCSTARSMSMVDFKSVPQSRISRKPAIPSPSALDPPVEYVIDDGGHLAPKPNPSVRRRATPDGRMAWMLVVPRDEDAAAPVMREVGPPPQRLSRRAHTIMAAKRRLIEEDIKQRRAAAPLVSEGTSSSRFRYPFPRDAFTMEGESTCTARSCGDARVDSEWERYDYAASQPCVQIRQNTARDSCSVQHDTERIVRLLQPIQVRSVPSHDVNSRYCSCVVYEEDATDSLRQLLASAQSMEDAYTHFLTLQPVQLANADLRGLVDCVADPQQSLPRGCTGDLFSKYNPQRGFANQGGIWCTATSLRDDGRPATRRDMKPQRRVMRICGGSRSHKHGIQKDGTSVDVRCYELLLFPQESTGPHDVNYGSDGVALGLLTPPPTVVFPLTPRIVDDPVVLKAYKKKILKSNSRNTLLQNGAEDRKTWAWISDTAEGAVQDSAKTHGRQYLTITLATISTRQRFTVDLTMVLLPYRLSQVKGDSVLADVPYFSPSDVMHCRRVHVMSLSFSTQATFLSAYKALLWTTECNVLDARPAEENAIDSSAQYVHLELSATRSPLFRWSISRGAPDSTESSSYRSSCLEFAVTMLTASHGALKRSSSPRREALMLEDFLLNEHSPESNTDVNDAPTNSRAGSAPNRQRRRSSIFTSTIASRNAQDGGGSREDLNSNIVGFVSFGVVRRAVHQRTNEVFDVRVLPRSRARLMPFASSTGPDPDVMSRDRKEEEERLLQQDAEAAIMMEYVSCLPFQCRVHGVLVDEQRYYIFQEPWMSALTVMKSIKGAVEREALACNPTLARLHEQSTVISMKDLMHGILHPSTQGDALVDMEESRFQIAQLLAAQMLLLLLSLHGKGMILGPCPPQRLLVRVDIPKEEDADENGGPDHNFNFGTHTADFPRKKSSCHLSAKHVQLIVPDLGVSTDAWSYERQQCGVVEYLSPPYLCHALALQDSSQETRPWTMYDDWWTYLCLCFELFACDGSSLVMPLATAVVHEPSVAPTLSAFSSPADVLDVWKNVLTTPVELGRPVPLQEEMCANVRRYVRERVLQSITPSVDSWIVAISEASDVYGGGRNGRKGSHHSVSVGQPEEQVAAHKMFGVSLAAAYIQTSREKSVGIHENFRFGDSEPQAQGDNKALSEMSWMFHIRSFFDAIVDIAMLRSTHTEFCCSVHRPSLRMTSHPFFATVYLTEIFDGTYALPPAAERFVRRRMNKTEVLKLLAAYRARAFGGSVVPQRGSQLLLTGGMATRRSSMSANGREQSTPLLVLTSSGYREESFAFSPTEIEQCENNGLLLSTANRSFRAHSSSPLPTDLTQSAVSKVQQRRLRYLYKNDEMKVIADLESDVRSVLYDHAAMSSRHTIHSASGREVPNDPVAYYNLPTISHTVVDEMASTRSSRRRDPSAFEVVRDSDAPSVGRWSANQSPTNGSADVSLAKKSCAVASATSSMRAGASQQPHARSLDVSESIEPCESRDRPHTPTCSSHVNGTSHLSRLPFKTVDDESQKSVTHETVRSGVDARGDSSWPAQFLQNSNLEKKGHPMTLAGSFAGRTASFSSETRRRGVQTTVVPSGATCERDPQVVAIKEMEFNTSENESVFLVPSDNENGAAVCTISSHRAPYHKSHISR